MPPTQMPALVGVPRVATRMEGVDDHAVASPRGAPDTFEPDDEPGGIATAAGGGGGRSIFTVISAIDEPDDRSDAMKLVREALFALGETDPRLCRIVEMKYFLGLEEREIATALRLSQQCVERTVKRARLLLRAMSEG